MENLKRRLAGSAVPIVPQRVKMTPATAIISNAFALSVELGISERDIAVAALTLAIVTAEKHGDPDGYLANLMALIAKEKR